MSEKELEIRCFFEEAKNISIKVDTYMIKTKQYIIKFNEEKNYKTTRDKLIIGNRRFEALNLMVNWEKIKIIKNKLVIPVYDGEIIIEEF